MTTIKTKQYSSNYTDIEKTLSKMILARMSQISATENEKARLRDILGAGTFEYAVACDMLDRGYNFYMKSNNDVRFKKAKSEYWNDVLGLN